MVNAEKFCPFTESNICYTSCIFYRLNRQYNEFEEDYTEATVCLLEKAAEKIVEPIVYRE